jgi:3-dehydroquinate synthase
MLLNFGHCFGHGVESVTNYRLPHGQAVVLGMRLANRVAEARGLLTSELAQRTDRLFQATLRVLPKARELEPEPLLLAMGRDKKRTGQGLALILMKTGLVFEQVQDLTPEEVRAALAAERAGLPLE